MAGPRRDWLDDFVRYLREEKRYSPHTLKGYTHDLERLAGWCEHQGIADWPRLTGHEVRRFSAELHRQGLGGRSLQRQLSAVRRFYHFLMREGRADANPALDIPAPKSPRKLPKALDVDEIGQLMRPTGDDPLTLRDAAMLELMYSSGLRLAELVGLNLDDVDREDAQLRVTGKGSKQRDLPVGRMALKALAAWLKVRANLARPEERALFVNRRGTRLSARSVQKRFRERGLTAGLERGVHPHMLRHSFASHMLESSGDLRAVQELLGHADISTTQIYTHLDFQHLAKVYDAAHPRARKRRGD